MHHTLVALVEDKPGVLNRVASLFRRRAFNIESLTVGRTDVSGISRMTVVIDSDQVRAGRTFFASSTKHALTSSTPESRR